jgi:transcriptional regulator with XRE-family HTH domain
MERGQKLKQLREAKNLLQTDAAKLIGTSKQSLFKYENDIITNIPSDIIEKMAKLYGTTPGYIMGWDDPDADQANEVAELYDAYINASPEIRAAVNILLKGQQPSSGPPHSG